MRLRKTTGRGAFHRGKFNAAVAFVVAFFAAIAFWQGPHPVHKAVDSSTIPASVCGTFGSPPLSAVETDDAGPYPLLSVRCADGVVVPWADPR